MSIRSAVIGLFLVLCSQSAFSAAISVPKATDLYGSLSKEKFAYLKKFEVKGALKKELDLLFDPNNPQVADPSDGLSYKAVLHARGFECIAEDFSDVLTIHDKHPLNKYVLKFGRHENHLNRLRYMHMLEERARERARANELEKGVRFPQKWVFFIPGVSVEKYGVVMGADKINLENSHPLSEGEQRRLVRALDCHYDVVADNNCRQWADGTVIPFDTEAYDVCVKYPKLDS